MGKHHRQLNYRDRLKIEDLYKEKHSVIDIAERIGVTRQTIYNELKRGKYLKRRDSDWKDIECYSADLAQHDYEEKTSMRGCQLKIGSDQKFADYVEKKILEDHYSPEAVLGEIDAKGLQFETHICVATLYSYISKGLFLNLTNKDLPVKAERKRPYKRVRKKVRNHTYGNDLEARPDEVNSRENFGDWEMDTVVGPRGKSKHSLLVLTERKTRKEIVRILTEHTAANVVRVLDKLEKEMGDLFHKVFRTITVDNGTEFSYFDEMQRSALDKNKNRTTVYYCHPYSSYERGSNENANRLIRRHIKKSINFDDATEKDIQKIEDWMNNYPRGIFNFHTANEMYDFEMKQLLDTG